MKAITLVSQAFLALGTAALPFAGGAAGPDQDRITLARGVHFDTTDGKAALLPAREYRVDFAGRTLSLTAEDGTRTVIDAVWGTHTALLDQPLALAVPGEGEQSDVEFVTLLMPGGSMLEGLGTFSGVARRGLRDRIQNSKLGQAAQAAGAKLAETVSKVKENVGEAAQKVAESLPAEELQHLVQGIQDLGLRDLIQCITSSTDPNDPALLQYIAQLKSQGPDGFFRYVGQDIAQRLDDRFEVLLGRDLERLRKGQALPGVNDLVDEAFTKLKLLCEDRKGTRCLYEYMEPHLPVLKASIVQLNEEARSRFQSLFEKKIAPTLYAGLTDALQPILEPDWSLDGEDAVAGRGLKEDFHNAVFLSKWKTTAMAKGFYADSLTAQLKKATDELKKALAQNDPVAAKKVLDTVESWTDNAALRFGLDVIRARGHEAIDKGKASTVVNRAMQTLEVSKDLSAKLIDSLCGLVPEAGGAACAFLEAPLRVLWNYVGRQALLSFVFKIVHTGWELVMQGAETKLVEKANASDPGPLGALLAGFTEKRVLAVADKSLPELKSALKNYDDQLRALITKWQQAH